MTAAIITASASVVVAMLVFVLNRRTQVQLERRQAVLDRVDRQLKCLYGPLYALVTVNEDVWRALRESTLPGKEVRRSGATLTDEQAATWKSWLTSALMPANVRMRDLIVENADLVIEGEMPEPLRDFCAHVAAYEVLLAHDSGPAGLATGALIRHPGQPYVAYVQKSYADLKKRQVHLLSLNARRGP